MDFRRIISSTKSYKVALVVAIALLLLLSSISYRQINNMRKSADLVSASLLVDREINNLFSNFNLIESSEYRSLIINDSTFINKYKDYKRQSETSFLNLSQLTKDIPEQLQFLDTVNQWRDSLDITVNNLGVYRGQMASGVEQNLMAEIVKLTTIFKKLNSLKMGMFKQKEALFKERMIAYKTETFFTPFISLLLVLFSLIVFWLAFRKINNSRQKLMNAQTFVDNIIRNSDNTITYLEPIRDEKNKIIDFVIKYVSNKIEENTGVVAEEVKDKLLSEAFPILFTNGVFEICVKCMETGKSENYLRSYTYNNKLKWFNSIATKLENGVNITSIDITKEKQKTNDLKNLNENLFLKNAILNNAEVVAKIGSFTRYPDTGIIEMSDNLYSLIGCKPLEFEPSLVNFKNYVHPDDLNKFDKAVAKNVESKGITESSYRVITKNKKHKHFKASSLMITENGRKKIVGVVQDVTQIIKKDKKLEQKNKALERSNAELESFNRVVSHDLQEPLRKIQMFISLLSETERSNLSKNGIEFFEKIDNSAGRMQLLIKNLLTYSRIDDSHENFQDIDLNKKLEKVKDNLSERIKEANVTIIENELPTIRAIPFQMEQLFNNLLSNAIKYRNTAIDAKILIDASIVHKDQISLPHKKTSKNYHKIIVSDNGIGFDQDNANKIFEIFERLHQKTEYSGTGVGLAICKKIVENHNGFIHATSELQKGSTFYIYLPV